MRRRRQILQLLMRYRNAGVFSVIQLDPGMPAIEPPPVQGDPARFVADLEALGTTFVKLGQVLSTRPDMIPPPYLAALERMQERVAPVPVEHIIAVIEAELGAPVSKLFTVFDPVPLGCASIAQVHRAVLRDGREVAVKVQKPEVAAQLRSDLAVLRNFASAADHLTRVGRRVRLADWLAEFSRTLRMELDYEAEAANLERFRQHLAPYPELWVPQPVHDLSSRRVLTMELVPGVRVDAIPAVRRTEESMDPLAAALVRGYLDQIFVHGEIHADPHPGNLRVTPDKRLAIFDLGMVAHVPPRLRERLLKILFAAVDGRGEEVADEIIGISTRLEDYDEERYLRETGQMIARYAANGSMSEGRVVLEIVRIATFCGLRTPPELTILGKALLNLESVCQTLALDDVAHVQLGRQLQYVMRARMKKSFSRANLASEAMELQQLVRLGPRRVSDILGLMSENRLQMKVTGLDESRLMENIQKVANRVAAGLITAALLVSSVMLMRIPTRWTLFGYPGFAMLLFLIAVGIGLCLILSALLFDRRTRSHEREERGHR
jgi:predicted unusual protein kinase regulating ubiquinone biosynthesis (AarF/ABC1/UbiB family)